MRIELASLKEVRIDELKEDTPYWRVEDIESMMPQSRDVYFIRDIEKEQYFIVFHPTLAIPNVVSCSLYSESSRFVQVSGPLQIVLEFGV